MTGLLNGYTIDDDNDENTINERWLIGGENSL